MSYFIMLVTVYISTLHLWYSLQYLLNLCVRDFKLAFLQVTMMFTIITYFYVIFIYLTLYLILNYATT